MVDTPGADRVPGTGHAGARESDADIEILWRQLHEEGERLRERSTLSLFEEDPARAADFSLEAATLLLDFSKNRVSRRALELLLALAKASRLPMRIQALLTGEPVNTTEHRAAFHTALRDRSGRRLAVAGVEVGSAIAATRERLLSFVDAVHTGRHRGATGKALTTVVNIGIGGSDLGPQMVVEALRAYWIPGRRSFFVSNVDGQHLRDTLADLDYETTLFIIASKTFTTQETMANARSAQRWFLDQGGTPAGIAAQFVALSSNPEAVANFGIGAEQTFGFDDWVGGRYSLWSSIGLSIALQTGGEQFLALLDGAYALDTHFATAPLSANLPVLLALVGVWNRNIEGLSAHAVLPYDQHLHRLPAYLQQADMESNGKSVRIDGTRSARETGPIIFGEPGTNGQHAFFQLLHQGTDRVSADFIAAASVPDELADHHRMLLANVLAQPQALMIGKSAATVAVELRAAGLAAEDVAALAPHKVFDGNRPSSVILMRRLTPATLGALIALYEHKIYCQGVIWGINSFDQWGVELGKALAQEILPLLDRDASVADQTLDPSTRQLLQWINARRRE